MQTGGTSASVGDATSRPTSGYVPRVPSDSISWFEIADFVAKLSNLRLGTALPRISDVDFATLKSIQHFLHIGSLGRPFFDEFRS